MYEINPELNHNGRDVPYGGSGYYDSKRNKGSNPIATGVKWFLGSWLVLFIAAYFIHLDIGLQTILSGTAALFFGMFAGYLSDRFGPTRRMLRTHEEHQHLFPNSQASIREIRHLADTQHEHLKTQIMLFISMSLNFALIVLTLVLLFSSHVGP